MKSPATHPRSAGRGSDVVTASSPIVLLGIYAGMFGLASMLLNCLKFYLLSEV